jgi:hypothetical protein
VLDPDEATLTLVATDDALLAADDTLPALVDTLLVLLDTPVFNVARAVVDSVPPVTGPEPVIVVVRLTGPGPIGKVETLIGPTVPVPVAAVVFMALYWAHKAFPMDCMTPISLAGQEARRQVATMAPMEAWVGPHWQAWSDSAQPALEMAEERQAVAQAGSLPKFWAVERVRRVVMRVRRVSFMVEVVVVVVG